MDRLDLVKVPERYKEEEKRTVMNGQKVTIGPSDQASYEIEFGFELKDRDGFILQTLHAKGLSPLISGEKNTFQAKMEDPIAYDTAIKVQQIVVRPTIVECYSCQPKVEVKP